MRFYVQKGTKHNDEYRTMNDELRSGFLLFIIPRSSFVVSLYRRSSAVVSSSLAPLENSFASKPIPV
jgi:hypothetical protein